MPYASDKSNALKRVVKAAIESDDFNMAIIAAKQSPYAATKAEMLDEVVMAAIKSKETKRYAVVAADNMPYSSSKSIALQKIVSAYETYAKQAAPAKTDDSRRAS